ncbi:MAG: di-trans,poly-cis-decaprenylcistransferase [Chloroflexi bacterium RBG_13_53_26]|jgi:undecaprenyl diphosphate synthase|nr:MAG: di-trans,poly-cis-decaprenylcistransferase [Chloroflexi bacterium RBG_13_53_26]
MEDTRISSTAITPLPVHVAVIMDGNVRWAEQHNLSRLEGHRAGTENIRRVVENSIKYQVKYLTLYAFSTENWRRPKIEVRELMQILGRVIKRETRDMHQKGIRLHHLGRIDRLSERLQKHICYAIELTKDNKVMTLSVAFDYGSRAEIVNAARQIVREGISPDMIDENLFGSYLYSAGLPDPDLIIRTAGEVRLSNFLLWQSAYSELYFTPVYWPDFDEEELRKALIAYSRRGRNFGV